MTETVGQLQPERWVNMNRNLYLSKKERKSRELFNAVATGYTPSKESGRKDKVENWVDELANDAQFNFGSYAECFISENLIRKFIGDKSIPLSTEAITEVAKWKGSEKTAKNRGNISIDVRQSSSDLMYLDMSNLSALVDKKDALKEACLIRDSWEYKPMRDAVAHTALLTSKAKVKLNSVYENIKARVKSLLET